MKTSHYAIVDIETTGGFAAANQITEIAILISDGSQVIEEFSTLINPQQPIPFHIQTLTGITDDMVENAPVFREVAERIFQLLDGKIFVAHNVHFDYSFVLASLKDAGYNWKANKLCTVRLSRKIFPNLGSYSLGRLCKSLSIAIQDRHRAYGDAAATLTLFHQLLAADSEQFILQAVQAKAKEQRLPTHIPREDFDRLPDSTGVYLFKNASGKIIYVGKAVNIRKRVISHFTGNNMGQRRQKFVNEICAIDFEETGTELMAFLKECHLIKKIWPAYNSALKKFEPKYGLLDYEDVNGYLRLSICQVRKHVQPTFYFNTVHESTVFLLKLANDFELDLRLCSFFSNPALPKEPKMQNPSTELPDQATYNARVTAAIEALLGHKRSFVILDRGRREDEYSFVYYRENKVYAIGFMDRETAVENIEDYIEQEHKVLSNFYMNNLAESYAQKHPRKVIYLQGQPLEEA
ncbi:exonuclease domain-containing protein [Sphingobacterium lactis]|uniref:DNA polymerase-3 subunit epsilon n=1 Tax=Sphingobacterium lactis TaxID=797291 RepID=A0A1H5YQX5_9SPHI|nr:exonuclease domain-containing protein [Sphingobacterium lactis]SEG26539.1 DNA polymerase-3 subunit epsilon [Sphingobacterium lactis]